MSVIESAQRPGPPSRSKSTFSYKSDKSHGSGDPERQRRDSLRDSFDKRRLTMSEKTKANPNAAMNEAEPIDAAFEKPTLSSLRSFTHTDPNGNYINEPDLSNPTRSRWERPLDTIRSFEAAIDSGYKRRSQYAPESSQDTMNGGYASRRSSVYGDYNYNQNRYSYAGSYYGNKGLRDSYAESNHGHPPSAPPRNRYNARLQPDSAMPRYNQGQSVYPTPSYHQSRDTVYTGISNGSQSEPMGYSTDPSSDNSSVDRITPVAKPEPPEHYGFSGFGGAPNYNGPILEEYRNHNVPEYPHHGRSLPNNNNNRKLEDVPPPAPPKFNGPNRAGAPPKIGRALPQPLATSNGNAQPYKSPTVQRAGSEKRRSWFKRKFGRE